MLDRLDTTIVAVSTAPGRAPVGIVRLSGPDALDIADRTVRLETHRPCSTVPGSRRVLGEVPLDSGGALPVALYVFRSPHSYTRQDLVELHTIGGPAVLDLVCRLMIAGGAVPAEPGEFTARAFLNGAMDLSSAEAVSGLIRAQTDTQLRASRRIMDGTLATRIKQLRGELAELVALVEADIDFAEEPIEFITPATLRRRLDAVIADVRSLSGDAVLTERLDRLPQILLVGPPNAGKSTLMNRLSATDRAICAAAAGTTRDILSAPVKLDAGDAILLDSAGLNRSDDELLARAQARTLEVTGRVDLLCLVIDLSDDGAAGAFDLIDSPDTPSVVVAANKHDLISKDQANAVVSCVRAKTKGPVCVVSALKGTGLPQLRAALSDGLHGASTTVLEQSILLTHRQHTAIDLAAEALARAHSLACGAKETIDCADLLAFELREALDHLGAVTGEITTDDLLGQVFAEFCIGK